MSMGLLLNKDCPAAPRAIDLPTLMKRSLPHANAITKERRIMRAPFNIWQAKRV